MSEQAAIRWTVVVNPQRAWVFERKGPSGRMSTVFSVANPGAQASQSALAGWATRLAEHLRLARSAGRFDYLELIAEGPLIDTVDDVTRYHVDHAIDAVIQGTDDGKVRRAARRLVRRNDEQN